MKNSKLLNWRSKTGRTQVQAAELLGVDERTYRRWESGNSRTPTAVMMLLETLTVEVKQ